MGQPLTEHLAERFTVNHPQARIAFQRGLEQCSAVIQAVGEGRADVGIIYREIEQSELEAYPNLQAYAFGGAAIVIGVHPDTLVEELTMKQVRDIFAGEITNWSEVGGSDEHIIVVSYGEVSPTRAWFEKTVMGPNGTGITDIVLIQPEPVWLTVSTTPNSIGYFSIHGLNESVKALVIDGVEATETNAIRGTYPLTARFRMVTNGAASGMVKDWLDFILSEQGQNIVDIYYVPVNQTSE
jgi:phosphate transport system substrate-binding protein